MSSPSGSSPMLSGTCLVVTHALRTSTETTDSVQLAIVSRDSDDSL